MSNEHYLQITANRDMGGGNQCVNVFHVAPSSGGWIGTDTTAIANYFIGRLQTFYTSCGTAGLAGGQTIGQTVIEYEYNEAPKYVPATAVSVGASTGGAFQPLQLAAVVSWRTALAGRAYRGRSFLGPLTASAVSGSALAAGFVSGVNAAATVLVASASGTFKFVVVSKSGLHWHKTGDHTYASAFHTGFTTPITSGSTGNAIRTMRSRA
jgi:hypothetical protein